VFPSYTVTKAKNSYSLEDTKSLDCHKCDVKIYLSGFFAKEKGSVLLGARRALSRHYVLSHLPRNTRELVPHKFNAEYLCLTCPFCPFQTRPINCRVGGAERLSNMRRNSMYPLFKHCKSEHDNTSSSSKGTVKDIKKLKEGKDILWCPQDGCPFLVHVLKSGETLDEFRSKDYNVRYNRRKLCVAKLGNHFLKEHDFPLRNFRGTHPCEQRLGGDSGTVLQCPRCEFNVPLKECRENKTAHEFFRYHYGQHISRGEMASINNHGTPSPGALADSKKRPRLPK
jgi:hypothetical protein